MKTLNASFTRRFAALFYDSLMATSIFVVTHLACFLVVATGYQLSMIDLSEYQGSVGAYLQASHGYSLLLIVAVALSFIWFWTHGGQTPGMKAWRLRVQNEDGTTIHFRQAVVRVCFAFAGLGNLMILINPKAKLALQDKLSDSVVVLLPSPQKTKY